MTWWRAAAYWVCFLALVGYYLIGEHPPEAETAQGQRASFLNLPEERIMAIELHRKERHVHCRRIEGSWQLVQPAGGTVPADLIAALVANLAQLSDVDLVADNNKDLAQFGLETPASQITLTPDAGEPIRIQLGIQNPAGTAEYAERSGSHGVYLIGLNVRYYEDLVFEMVGS
jgi:hypothetical protein